MKQHNPTKLNSKKAKENKKKTWITESVFLFSAQTFSPHQILASYFSRGHSDLV